MASIYKRGNWFWIAYYANGKHVQRTLGTQNARIARDLKRKIEYEIALGELGVASRLRVRTILQLFCRHLIATRTFKSYKNDMSRLRIFFGPICEALIPGGGRKAQMSSGRPYRDKYAHAHVKVEYMEDVTPEIINQFIACRIQQNRWSPKNCNNLRQVLHRLFVYATKHHGFRSRDRRYPNPVDGVERQREPAPKIRFLSLGQIGEQLEALESHPLLHPMVATYIYAGLRREEALWLTHDDVNLVTRLIHVRAKTVDGAYWQPKTKKNRVVPVSESLLEILKRYEPRGGSLWYFASPKDRRRDPDNFSQDLREINKQHGLNWSCLDFRHTFGSQLAQKGESLFKIATLLGNSPEICRRHYAALIPETMHDSVEFADAESAQCESESTLLKELLKELRARKVSDEERPRFRLLGD